MPFTAEEKKAKKKEYYEKNKEKIKARMKARYQNKKEEIKTYVKKWQEENKEHRHAYSQTPQRIKMNRIRRWKSQGIISNDWNSLYERFKNTKNCESCGVTLSETKIRSATTRTLDHNHSITDSDNVRNVLCCACNSSRK